jgi:hypothetical protein
MFPHHLRKIGGLHFLKIGRLNIQWSLKRVVEAECLNPIGWRS